MRIRLRELLDERGWTAYRLAQASDFEISPSTAYRLLRQNGQVRWLDAYLLETLCRVLNVPIQEVLERESDETWQARAQRPWTGGTPSAKGRRTRGSTEPAPGRESGRAATRMTGASKKPPARSAAKKANRARPQRGGEQGSGRG